MTSYGGKLGGLHDMGVYLGVMVPPEMGAVWELWFWQKHLFLSGHMHRQNLVPTLITNYPTIYHIHTE